MKKKNIFIYIIVVSALIFADSLEAQVKNSIYSMFGVGQLIDNGFGINRSLGGTGIAFQSGRSINYLNPASYLGIPPSSYILEVGVYGSYNKSENNKLTQTDADINFSYLSANLYLTNWWAFSFGVVPFTSVDYEINSSDNIGGEVTSFEKNYKGSGGLNRVYFGNSFNIYKGLSAGFNASYIIGHISQTETALSTGSFTGYKLENKRTASSFYLDYGLQYSISDDDWVYTTGLTYGAGRKLNTTDDLEFTYNGTTSSLEQEKQLDIKIPQKLGIGIAVKKGNSFRAGLDYEWGNWSDINFSNPNLDTKNSNRFSVGMEYSPGQGKRDAWWLESLSFRLGAKYKNTYLKIDNTPINSMGINFGVGVPFDGTSLINLSVEYGEEGTLSKGLIKNHYWGFYFNISLHEFWSTGSRRN